MGAGTEQGLFDKNVNCDFCGDEFSPRTGQVNALLSGNSVYCPDCREKNVRVR